MKALVLAAGLGTRLRPLTDRVPKCLVEIAGRPLLDYWLDALAAAGVREALTNTHHLREVVAAHLCEVNRRGRVRVTETYEPRLLGSAGTIRANRAWLDDADHGLIVYADNLSSVDLAELLRRHVTHGDPLTMLLFRAAEPSRCGIAELDGDGRVIAFVEKPEQPKSDLANAGVYAVTADAWREIADLDATDFGFHVLPRFVGRMRGWAFGGYHLDIGSPAALARARADAPAVFRTARAAP